MPRARNLVFLETLLDSQVWGFSICPFKFQSIKHRRQETMAPNTTEPPMADGTDAVQKETSQNVIKPDVVITTIAPKKKP